MAEFQWKSVISHVPQGLILEQVLFNIFINYIDEGIECTLSKSEHDTKLSDAVETPEESNAIQRDLDKLEKAKCQMLDLGRGSPRYESRPEEMNLG